MKLVNTSKRSIASNRISVISSGVVDDSFSFVLSLVKRFGANLSFDIIRILDESKRDFYIHGITSDDWSCILSNSISYMCDLQNLSRRDLAVTIDAIKLHLSLFMEVDIFYNIHDIPAKVRAASGNCNSSSLIYVVSGWFCDDSKPDINGLKSNDISVAVTLDRLYDKSILLKVSELMRSNSTKKLILVTRSGVDNSLFTDNCVSALISGTDVEYEIFTVNEFILRYQDGILDDGDVLLCQSNSIKSCISAFITREFRKSDGLCIASSALVGLQHAVISPSIIDGSSSFESIVVALSVIMMFSRDSLCIGRRLLYSLGRLVDDVFNYFSSNKEDKGFCSVVDDKSTIDYSEFVVGSCFKGNALVFNKRLLFDMVYRYACEPNDGDLFTKSSSDDQLIFGSKYSRRASLPNRIVDVDMDQLANIDICRIKVVLLISITASDLLSSISNLIPEWNVGNIAVNGSSLLKEDDITAVHGSLWVLRLSHSTKGVLNSEDLRFVVERLSTLSDALVMECGLMQNLK